MNRKARQQMIKIGFRQKGLVIIIFTSSGESLHIPSVFVAETLNMYSPGGIPVYVA